VTVSTSKWDFRDLDFNSLPRKACRSYLRIDQVHFSKDLFGERRQFGKNTDSWAQSGFIINSQGNPHRQ
jgi:hypothetical protein